MSDASERSPSPNGYANQPPEPDRQLERLWQQGERPDVCRFLAEVGPLPLDKLAAVLAVDQRERWLSGERVPAEDYLRAHPDLAADVERALELGYGEFLLREGLGETPQPQEYLRRFPQYAGRLGQQFRLHQALGSDAGEPTWTEPVDGAPPSPGAPALPYVAGYEILGQLGKGGMGIVYRAQQLGLDRVVALKMLRAAEDAGPEERQRFQREAEAAARLQHPNIVQVFEVGDQDGQPFLSQEFVEGGSLAQKLAGTPLPPREAARLLETLAEAMQHAHARGVLHRDLKPANVLLTGDGVPKISDFGLAKRLRGESGASVTGSQTVTGVIMGTPSYMAPEQAEGKSRQIGRTTDVRALGALLYECLTGRPPFVGEDALSTLYQVVSDDPVPPRRLQPRVAADLETICLKCLEKAPSRRYGSAEELADDLRAFQEGRPIKARPVGALGRLARWARRRPAVAAMLALVVAVTAVAFGMVSWQWRETIEARDTAEVARQKEEELKRQFQRLSVGLLLDRGVNLCERGDVGRGMLWLTRSLELASAEEKDLQRAIRTNLADWGRQLAPLKMPLTHKDLVRAAAFSPDGKRVLIGCTDRTATLWDAATGRPAGPLLKNPSSVDFVAFSADGQTLLTGDGNVVRLWDAGGKPVQSLICGPDLLAVALSPDGKTIATGGRDKKARLWDAKGALLSELAHDAAVRIVAFSPDGKMVLTGSGDEIVLWNAANGARIETLPHPRAITAVVFHPTGRRILTAASSAHFLWETATGDLVGRPVEHRSTVYSVAFSPDGKTFATGNRDGFVRRWSASTGEWIQDLGRHSGAVLSVAFSPDGKTVVSGSLDQTARVWDVSSGQPNGAPLPHPSEVQSVAFSPDGKTILTRSDERTARLWEAPSAMARAYELRHDTSSVVAAAFSPDGKMVVTGGGREKKARLWHTATGKQVGSPLEHKGDIWTVAFSPDSKIVLTGGLESAQLRDAGTGRPLLPGPLPHKGTVTVAVFSPDGKTFLTAGSGLKAQLWDAATAKRLRELEHPPSIVAAAFSPDGKTILIANAKGTARLFNAATGQPFSPLLTHQDAVRVVAFSPDGQIALTGSDDGTVRLWDAATGEPRGEPLQHHGRVRAVAFSPDGKTILTGSDDQNARLWDLATGKLRGAPLEHQGAVRSVAFSPDGKMVLTGSRDRKGRFWDVATGKPLGMPLQQGNPLLVVAFSPDGKTALTAGSGTARLWPVPVPAPIPGNVERVVLWIQTLTGLELDTKGAVGVLDAEKWQQRRQRLDQLGGPPLP